MSDDRPAVDSEALAQWFADVLTMWSFKHSTNEDFAEGLLASGVVQKADDVRRDAQAEVANAFVTWAAKNEITEPPLD